MMRTLTKNWWLLAVSGVLAAIISVIYFLLQDSPFHSWKDAIALLGGLALAAGAVAIAGSFWRPGKGTCWSLTLYGLGLVALGLTYSEAFGSRISFRTIALLLVVTAISIGTLES